MVTTSPEIKSTHQAIIDQYLGLLAEYVKIPSVSAHTEDAYLIEAAAFTARRFQEIGGNVEILTDNPRPVVFAEFKAAATVVNPKTILFYNHYDVQAAEPLHLWHHNPFTLIEEDGKFIGRGVDDDKGNLIARLTALRLYLSDHGNLPVNIKFLVEGEEEVASEHLESYLAKYADKFANDLVIWESGTKTATGKLELIGGNKGVATFNLIAHSADHDLHSSLAAVVDSATWRLAQAIATLRDADGRVAVAGFYDNIVAPTAREIELVDALDDNTELLRKAYGLELPYLTDLSGRNLNHELLFQPALNIEAFHSGYEGDGVKTILPADAIAKFDVRLVPGMDPHDVVSKIHYHLINHGFSDIEVEFTLGEKGYRSDMSNPLIEEIVKTAKAVYGNDKLAVAPTSAGTGPMEMFHSQLHAPIVAFGIGYPDTLDHAPNENIRKVDYLQGIDYIYEIIKSFN